MLFIIDLLNTLIVIGFEYCLICCFESCDLVLYVDENLSITTDLHMCLRALSWVIKICIE